MAQYSAGKYIVGKGLEREGVWIEPGTIVDVTGWRNVDKLVTLRYLRPAPRSAAANAVNVTPDVTPDAIDFEEAPVKKVAAKKAPAKKAAVKKVEE
jgi:hypothetical protein